MNYWYLLYTIPPVSGILEFLWLTYTPDRLTTNGAAWPTSRDVLLKQSATLIKVGLLVGLFALLSIVPGLGLPGAPLYGIYTGLGVLWDTQPGGHPNAWGLMAMVAATWPLGISMGYVVRNGISLFRPAPTPLVVGGVLLVWLVVLPFWLQREALQHRAAHLDDREYAPTNR